MNVCIPVQHKDSHKLTLTRKKFKAIKALFNKKKVRDGFPEH